MQESRRTPAISMRLAVMFATTEGDFAAVSAVSDHLGDNGSAVSWRRMYAWDGEVSAVWGRLLSNSVERHDAVM
jgi:hypothetical protein